MPRKTNKKKEKRLTLILVAALAIHLLYSNADLIRSALELSNVESVLYSEYVFAASYSILTVVLISLYPARWLIIIVSLLDGFGIYLKYNVHQAYFIEIVSVYFGLYTMVIVFSSGLINAK